MQQTKKHEHTMTTS